MKNKGFTLIELLAVIVILAIIALIATPIIIGIINDSKVQGEKRSIEMYGKAIQNAVAQAQLDGTPVASGALSDEFLASIDYDGSRVTCETSVLYSDGKVYLAGCSVANNEVEYTYGSLETIKYYVFDVGDLSDGIPESAKTNLADLDTHGEPYYVMLESEDGKTVSKAKACLVKDGVEYCLIANDTNEYDNNMNTLQTAFSDVINDSNYCYTSFKVNNICLIDGADMLVNTGGFVGTGNGVTNCACLITGSSYQCYY